MLGSAFSCTVRCLMLLLLPQLFSREGRMALLSYIYFLVLTGPSENFTANVEVLSRGLSCGQEKVANETRRMLDIATSPLKAVYDKIKKLMKVILDFGALMKKAFLSIKSLFSEIFGAIRRAVQWLYNLVNVCNRRMGEPYEKCRKPLNDAHEDCLSMMPSILSWLCSPVKLVEYVCYVAKAITVLCAIPAIIIDFVKVQVIDRIERAMKRFLERAYTAFYVNITVTHEYNYSLEFSRSPSEVRGEIVRELRARVAVFTGIFRLLSNGVFLAVLYVVYTSLPNSNPRGRHGPRGGHVPPGGGVTEPVWPLGIHDASSRRAELSAQTVRPGPGHVLLDWHRVPAGRAGDREPDVRTASASRGGGRLLPGPRAGASGLVARAPAFAAHRLAHGLQEGTAAARRRLQGTGHRGPAAGQSSLVAKVAEPLWHPAQTLSFVWDVRKY
uniref:Putative ubiquitin-protein ligase dcst1 n=1 Tax=Ixodes ricinus TaxID=34613 RepID=A0A6B0VB83_IXORI